MKVEDEKGNILDVPSFMPLIQKTCHADPSLPVV